MSDSLRFAFNTSFTAEIYPSIQEVSDGWDEITGTQDLFLSREYLSILERYPPGELSFCYVLVEIENTPVGCLHFQWIPFCARNSLSGSQGITQNSLFDRANRRLKNWLADRIRWNTVVLGNLLLTGEYHSIFRENLISDVEISSVIQELLNPVKEHFAQRDLSTDMVLLKDFIPPSQNVSKEHLKSENTLFPFAVQPNMVVPIDAKWADESDYLADMQSKYRLRMRKARKRMEGLSAKELNLRFLRDHSDRVYALYKNIADRASFNLFYLHPEYFVALKESLEEEVRFFGYFKEDRIIAFYILIENGNELIAHYIGYEPGLLKLHDLYLNMLLDMVSCAVYRRKSELVLARTATEIKSSVGAEPGQLVCYARHENRLTHRTLPVLLKYLRPEGTRNIRHPFKRD